MDDQARRRNLQAFRQSQEFSHIHSPLTGLHFGHEGLRSAQGLCQGDLGKAAALTGFTQNPAKNGVGGAIDGFFHKGGGCARQNTRLTRLSQNRITPKSRPSPSPAADAKSSSPPPAQTASSASQRRQISGRRFSPAPINSPYPPHPHPGLWQKATVPLRVRHPLVEPNVIVEVCEKLFSKKRLP
jgi:hypothetical protein